MATVKVYVKGEEGVPYKGVMLAMAWLTVNIQGGVWSLKGLDRTSYRLRILLDKTVSSCILRLTPRMPWRELCGSPTFVLFLLEIYGTARDWFTHRPLGMPTPLEHACGPKWLNVQSGPHKRAAIEPYV